MTDNELIANALNATATDGSATTSSVPKDGAVPDALTPELWSKAVMDGASVRRRYQQEIAERMAQQFDAVLMEQQRRMMQGTADDTTSSMLSISTTEVQSMADRTGCTLDDKDLELLGHIVEFTRDPEVAAHELELCQRDPEYQWHWVERVRHKIDKQRHAASAARRSGKTMMFNALYGSAMIKPEAGVLLGVDLAHVENRVHDSLIMGNGATLVLKDELTGMKPVPKSAGEAATNSLRDKFRKYNPFK